MLTVERLLECRYQLIHLERLHQIGEGVAVDGLERRRKRGVSRHENDLEIRRGQSKRLQELDARDVRETDIDDRGVEAHRADLLEALGAAHGAPDHEPFRLEHVADRLAHPGLVVDDEDPSRRIHSRTLTTTLPSRRTLRRDRRAQEVLELQFHRGERDRLGETRIGARGQEPGNDVGIPGDAQDPGRLCLGVALEVPADLDSVELGHHDVENQQRGPERAQLDQSLVAVARGLDLETARVIGEERDEHVHHLGLVVHDEHPSRRPRCRVRRHPVPPEEALKLLGSDPRVPARGLEGAEPSFSDPGLERGCRDLAMRGGLARGQGSSRGRIL